MFKVVYKKTGEVLFESDSWNECHNMTLFFDEDCRVE